MLTLRAARFIRAFVLLALPGVIYRFVEFYAHLDGLVEAGWFDPAWYWHLLVDSDVHQHDWTLTLRFIRSFLGTLLLIPAEIYLFILAQHLSAQVYQANARVAFARTLPEFTATLLRQQRAAEQFQAQRADYIERSSADPGNILKIRRQYVIDCWILSAACVWDLIDCRIRRHYHTHH